MRIACTDTRAQALGSSRALALAGETMPQTAALHNQLLRRLSASDLALLGPLNRVDTGLREVLEPADDTIVSVYFIDKGFASVVADAATADPVEIGVIGREGMTGLAIVLGDTQSPFETFVQAGGSALLADAGRVREAMAQSEVLRTILLRYARSFLIQIGSTAAANARSSIESRLARWLLMIEDRMGASYPMTHDLLSVMLAVHRTGVTLALQALEGQSLIKTSRGHIEIVDRKGLIAASHGAYGLAERQARRLAAG